MQVKISEDLSAFEFDEGMNSGRFYDDSIMSVLRENSGKWFEVDDRFLFKDQYIIKAGQSLSNHTITDLMIDRVKNDTRLGVNVCNYCGTINIASQNCEKTDQCQDLGVFHFNEKNTFFLKNHEIIYPKKEIKKTKAFKISSSFTIETFKDMFVLRSKFEGLVIFKITPKYFLIRSGFTWLQSQLVPNKQVNGLIDIRELLRDQGVI